MDKCPKCHQISLIYNPYIRAAKCLRLECSYREGIERGNYSKKFEKEDRNVIHKLSFPLNRKVAAK